jgi:hypothetical protein
MSDMPEPQHGRAVPAPNWTWPQRIYSVILGLVSAGIVGPGFFAIYETATRLVRPWFGADAWIVPVSAEVAFAALFGWGILLSWRKAADVGVRILFMGLIIVGSVALQAYAGRSAFPDAVAHLVVAGAFFAVTITVKAAITRLRGGKVKGDRISLGEFLASPSRAAGLWRWKNAWGEPSTSAARRRYMVLLYVIALAQADPRVGKRPAWRRNLPVTLRYELSTGLLPDAVSAGQGGWQEAAGEHVTGQLALLGQDIPSTPDVVTHAEPETRLGPEREARPERRATARPEPASGPALKLAPAKSRSMSPDDLEPHVLAMLEAYGTVSQARVKRDLHVSTNKAAEALRLAKQNRTVIPIGQRA